MVDVTGSAPPRRDATGDQVRVLIAEPGGFTPGISQLLEQSLGAEVVLGSDGDPETWFRDFDVVWLRLANRIGPHQLGAAPRCRILAVATTGLDHLDLEACAARGVTVVSLRGETELLRDVRATAELTIALMLAALRHLVPAATSVTLGGWDRDRFRGRELNGATVGLVGLGRLGSIVARYLDAFGATILATDPNVSEAPGLPVTLVDLDTLLAESDVISLHVSYVSGQAPVIGSRELDLVKPGAVLVNTSRGGIVDEEALLRCLRDGRLSAAALDVLDGEPGIGPEHPLVRYAVDHPEVTIVPHIGGNTAESVATTERFIAGRIVELVRGGHR